MREKLTITVFSVLFYAAIAAGFFLLIRGAISDPVAVLKGLLGFIGFVAAIVIIARTAAILTRAQGQGGKK